MGPKIGQLALFFGANDMGSVMMEENVVSAAGATYKLEEREICRLIRDAGWVPAQRDQYYNVLQAARLASEAPDLRPAHRTRRCGTWPERSTRRYIGAAPGLDDGADVSVRVQLPILGDAPVRDAQTQQRVEELADRNTEGQLSSEERLEYEALVAAADLVAVLQAKAKVLIAAEQSAA